MGRVPVVTKPSSSRVIPIVTAAVVAIAGITLLVFKRGGAGDPGSAEALVSALTVAGYAGDSERVLAACAGAVDCQCAATSLELALRRNLHQASLEFAGKLDAECAASPRIAGLRAEALARAGDHEGARVQAQDALGRDAENGAATYALAHVANAEGDPKVHELAQSALTRGREQPARLLLGLLAYRRGDMAQAREQFTKMVQQDPRDVDALYNLAVVAGAEGKYREAREAYLKVLAEAPKHADSRYNLIALTHSIGAKDEAGHHLKKLIEITSESDERVERAKTLLATPPPAPPAPPEPAVAPPAVSADGVKRD